MASESLNSLIASVVCETGEEDAPPSLIDLLYTISWSVEKAYVSSSTDVCDVSKVVLTDQETTLYAAAVVRDHFLFSFLGIAI